MQKTVLVFFSLLLMSSAAICQKSPVFETDGKALRGYDVVSYFTKGEPVKGVDSFGVKWNNTTWLFSSMKNLEIFNESPEKYIPQYGGYCAYGTAEGHKAPTQPDAWAIVNGKLYFNYNKKVKTIWDKDQQGFIEKANKNWPELKDKE
jgi:hypothetical protein